MWFGACGVWPSGFWGFGLFIQTKKNIRGNKNGAAGRLLFKTNK